MSYIDNIPPAVKQALDDHAEHGRRCGHFVTAVLQNDLRGAVCRADLASRAALHEIVTYVGCHLPGECYGSPEAVRTWLERLKGDEAPRLAALARSVREYG